MSQPVMEICNRCLGHGEREVILTTGIREVKKCWMCDGAGRLPVFKAPSPQVSTHAVPAPKKVQRPTSHLSAPLGDLSWLPSRRGKA